MSWYEKPGGFVGGLRKAKSDSGRCAVVRRCADAYHRPDLRTKLEGTFRIAKSVRAMLDRLRYNSAGPSASFATPNNVHSGQDLRKGFVAQ